MKAAISKKEEIIQTIQNCAAELGHAPTYAELIKRSRLRISAIKSNFGTYTHALWACGLEGRGPGYETRLRQLFEDWARLVRSLGRVPTIAEYQMQSGFSIRPLLRHFERWSYVPAALLEYCKKEGLEGEWGDVCGVIAAHLEDANEKTKTLLPTRPRQLHDQPIYGTPLTVSPLTYAPTHEGGVIFLFGTMAHELGFAVSRIQPDFPDCEAMREVRPGQWQRVRVEFEFESRNFLAHGHAVAGCDVIVCWNNNWEDCPLEVIELKRVFRQKMLAAGGSGDRA